MRSDYFSFPAVAKQNPWLDLARALAICLVILRHGEKVQPDPGSTGLIGNIFLNGWVGVDIFFVLSGYLISKQLLNASEKNFLAQNYFIDRSLRILPSYYVILITVTIGIFPFFDVDATNLLNRFIANVILIQDYTGSDINVVLWSLAVEEKFYLLAPFVVFYLLKSSRPVICILYFICIIIIFRYFIYISIKNDLTYYEFYRIFRSPFHFSLEPLLIGVALAFLHARGFLDAIPKPKLGGLFASLLFLAWIASHELMAEIGPWDAVLQPLVVGILSGLLIIFAILLSAERLPGERVFRVIARLSFALYLVHYPLISLASEFALRRSALEFWIYYIFLSFFCAVILHFSVEKPFLIIRDRLKKKANQAENKLAPIPHA